VGSHVLVSGDADGVDVNVEETQVNKLKEFEMDNFEIFQ
jgi:hypothetical protein